MTTGSVKTVVNVMSDPMPDPWRLEKKLHSIKSGYPTRGLHPARAPNARNVTCPIPSRPCATCSPATSSSDNSIDAPAAARRIDINDTVVLMGDPLFPVYCALQVSFFNYLGLERRQGFSKSLKTVKPKYSVCVSCNYVVFCLIR